MVLVHSAVVEVFEAVEDEQEQFLAFGDVFVQAQTQI